MTDQDPKEEKEVESAAWAPPPHPGPIPEILRQKSAPRGKAPESSDLQVRIAKMSSIATNFVVSVIAMGFLGWLVDRWQGTKPWFMLGGLILGLVYGFYRFIKEALAASRPPGSGR